MIEEHKPGTCIALRRGWLDTRQGGLGLFFRKEVTRMTKKKHPGGGDFARGEGKTGD